MAKRKLMMPEPLVSIVMNCYNGEKYLREAIDSIYLQTYQNWEIIFWDNASTDSTAEIAKSYDEKLKYFKSQETTVLGVARVQATKKATGKYIAFLDVDDIWIKDKLEKQLLLFNDNESNVGFVYGRSEVIFEDKSKDGFIIKDGLPLPEGDVFSELAKENFIVFSSAIVCRNFFYECGGFPPHFLHSPDYWVFLHMAKDYECRAIQDKVCCKYRIHQSNLSGKNKVITVKESINTLKNLQSNREVLIGLQYQYASLVIENCKEKKYLDAFRVLIKNKVWSVLLGRVTKKLRA